jgi:hypothetical protein
MANSTINEGDRVKFKIVQGDKGPKADSVEKISLDLEQISNGSNLTISNGTIQNATADRLDRNLTRQRQTGQTRPPLRLHIFGPQPLNMIGPKPRTNDSDNSDEDKLR